MNGAIKTAIVDASRLDGLDARAPSKSCRYLARIANLPLIGHVLESLTPIGIEQVLILCHPDVRDELASYVRNGAASGVEILFIETNHLSRGSLLSQLRDAAGDCPVLVHPGDCLFPGAVERLCDRFDVGDLDLVLLERFERISLQTEHNREGAKPIRPSHEQSVAAPCVLGHSVWPVLQSLPGGSLRLKSVIQALTTTGHRVGACEAGEYWCYSASSERLLVANRMLLDRLPFVSVPPNLGSDNDVQGRVSISPSAQVSGTTLRGPVLIGAETIIEDSFIGPYTSIDRGSTVIGTEIEYAMVLAGADVRYPGSRLEASVIGERAVVKKNLALPGGLHVILGQDARLILG